MKLYALIDGPPSMVVRLALKQLNIPHELIVVNYPKSEHTTEAFAKMNPQKEIPVLDDDGFYLSESNAILQYLCNKYAPDSSLYPKDPKQRAIVDQRLSFNLSFLYTKVLEYAVGPVYFDYPRTPLGLKKVHIGLETLETYFKQLNTKYVAGENLTIADFAVFVSVNGLETINLDFSKYELVSKWYQTFKSEYPELWEIVEEGMKMMRNFEANPVDLSELNHPYHPIKKVK